MIALKVLAWINSDTWNKGDFIVHDTENDTEVYKATPGVSDRRGDAAGPQV